MQDDHQQNNNIDYQQIAIDASHNEIADASQYATIKQKYGQQSPIPVQKESNSQKGLRIKEITHEFLDEKIRTPISSLDNVVKERAQNASLSESMGSSDRTVNYDDATCLPDYDDLQKEETNRMWRLEQSERVRRKQEKRDRSKRKNNKLQISPNLSPMQEDHFMHNGHRNPKGNYDDYIGVDPTASAMNQFQSIANSNQQTAKISPISSVTNKTSSISWLYTNNQLSNNAQQDQPLKSQEPQLEEKQPKQEPTQAPVNPLMKRINTLFTRQIEQELSKQRKPKQESMDYLKPFKEGSIDSRLALISASGGGQFSMLQKQSTSTTWLKKKQKKRDSTTSQERQGRDQGHEKNKESRVTGGQSSEREQIQARSKKNGQQSSSIQSSIKGPGLQSQTSQISKNSKKPVSILKTPTILPNVQPTSLVPSEEIKIKIFNPDEQQSPQYESYLIPKQTTKNFNRQLSTCVEATKHQLLMGVKGRQPQKNNEQNNNQGPNYQQFGSRSGTNGAFGLTRPGTQTTKQLNNLLVSQTSRVSTNRSKPDQKVVSFSNCVEEEGKSQETSFISDESFSENSRDKNKTPKSKKQKKPQKRVSVNNKNHSSQKLLVEKHSPTLSQMQKNYQHNKSHQSQTPLIKPSANQELLLSRDQPSDTDTAPIRLPKSINNNHDDIEIEPLVLHSNFPNQLASKGPHIVQEDINQATTLPKLPQIEKQRSFDPMKRSDGGGGDATPTFEKLHPHPHNDESKVNENSTHNQPGSALMKSLLRNATPQIENKVHYQYEDLEYCKKRLMNGLKARKFHYSKKGSEECIVMISEDKKRLYWQYTENRRNKKSDCAVKDIKAIVYGALSGTFFQYRNEILNFMKHENLKTASTQADLSDDSHSQYGAARILDQTKFILKNLRAQADKNPPSIEIEPFYAWQCVTMYMPSKTLDFVFEDEECLMIFINYIQALVIERINVERLKKLMNKKSLFGGILKSQPSQAKQQPFQAVKAEPMRSFRLMKIKMKIAYAALKAGQPILDFFINAVIKAFLDHKILNKRGVEKSELDDYRYFSWRAAFLGEPLSQKSKSSQSQKNESALPQQKKKLANEQKKPSFMSKSNKHIGTRHITPDVMKSVGSGFEFYQSIALGNLRDKHQKSSEREESSKEEEQIESDSLKSEVIDEEDQDGELGASSSQKHTQTQHNVRSIKPENIEDSFSQIPPAGDGDGFHDDISGKEGLRKILIEAASATHREEDDLDDTIETLQLLDHKKQKLSTINKTNSISWLQKARSGELKHNSALKVVKVDRRTLNKVGKSGSNFCKMYSSEEDQENLDTVILHPGLNELDAQITVKNHNIKFSPSLKPAPSPKLGLNLLQVQSQGSDVVKQFTFNNPKESPQQVKIRTTSFSQEDEMNSSQMYSNNEPFQLQLNSTSNDFKSRVHSIQEKGRQVFQTSEIVNKNLSNFPRRAKTGCYDKKQQDREADEEMERVRRIMVIEEEESGQGMIGGPNNREEEKRSRRKDVSKNESFKDDGNAGGVRMYDLDTEHFKIQSELIRPNGRENSRFDENDVEDISGENENIMLLDAENIPAQGLEFGERKNTFFRRAKTQHSPDNFMQNAQTATPSSPYYGDFDGKVTDNNDYDLRTEQRRMRDDPEFERAYMIELNILEIYFRLLSRNSIENADQFDKNIQAHSTSYKFYQTSEVFNFHRLNDHKEYVGGRALEYLRSIRPFLKNNPDRKAHILRKNLVLLGRKEQEQIIRLCEEELKQKLLENQQEQEHLMSIKKHREEKKVVKEDKGIGFWFKFACMKCMGTKTPQELAKERLDRKKASNPNSRSNSPQKTSPSKPFNQSKTIAKGTTTSRNQSSAKKQLNSLMHEFNNGSDMNLEQHTHGKNHQDSQTSQLIANIQEFNNLKRNSSSLTNNNQNQQSGATNGENVIINNNDVTNKSDERELQQNHHQQQVEMRTINSLLKRKDNEVKSLFQAVKVITKYQDAKDEVMEQLKLRQTMNLKAKGFFLDNADELSKLENRVQQERKTRSKEIKKKKTELLSLLQNDQVDENKSAIAAEELQEMGKSYMEDRVLGDQKLLLIKQRNMKLKKLQELLQKNADEEFHEFQEEFQQIRRPVRKLQMLTDRIHKEEMYFNPILNRLGQFRLVRQLKNQRTKSSGKQRSLTAKSDNGQSCAPKSANGWEMKSHRSSVSGAQQAQMLMGGAKQPPPFNMGNNILNNNNNNVNNQGNNISNGGLKFNNRK